ncbi:MAG: DUF2291 domain-containing protein [Pseudomonadota bacterium]|nr:DUF2291 domain-containing protein [Pseudomonadota bacterium]
MILNRRRLLAALPALSLGVGLAGCTFVATPKKPLAGADEGGFDPNAMVDAIWDTKVLAYLKAKAAPLPEVMTAIQANADKAGQRFGHRAKEGNQPWTYIVRIDGPVVAAETASRAATITVDDGAKALVQIGPAMRGTALRDSLDFVSFNDFKNQIDFAQYGKAFNQHVLRAVLANLPRDSLIGRKASVLGAFTFEGGDQPPLVAPAEITLGPAS